MTTTDQNKPLDTKALALLSCFSCTKCRHTGIHDGAVCECITNQDLPGPTGDHHRRMAGERRNLRHLLAEMAASGFKATAVNDGGDSAERCSTDEEAMGFIFGVDESWIYFSAAMGKSVARVFVVLGNSAAEVVNDWGVASSDEGRAADAVLERVTRSWDQ